MADGNEFWLPSEFLVDDLLLGGGVKQVEQKSSKHAAAPFSGFEFQYSSGSDPSSPLESPAATESDEEDYLAGLTRQMAHSFLHDDDSDSFALAGNKSQIPKVMAISPQSTLSGFGIWSESGGTSPNGPSQVCSPPSTPLEQRKDDAWDTLYAAAGQVAQMRLNDRVGEDKFNPRATFGLTKRSAIPTTNPSSCYYPSPVLTQQQIRFEQLKQQQLMKRQLAGAWERQRRARGAVAGGYADGRCARALGLPSSAWPPLHSQPQQLETQSNRAMRAVFLTSGARRASTGTGVFLPQRTGSHTEQRKKPACSPVLLPARVIQALNLNLDELNAHPRFPGAFVLGHDALMARSNTLMAKQKQNHHLHHIRPRPAATAHQEICLPSEWTY